MRRQEPYGWLYADLSKSSSIQVELQNHPNTFQRLLDQLFEKLDEICKRYSGERFTTAGDSITFMFPGKPSNVFRAAREILGMLGWIEQELDLPKIPAHKIQMKLIGHVTSEDERPDREQFNKASLFFSRVDDKTKGFVLPGRPVISEDLQKVIIAENPSLAAYFEPCGIVRIGEGRDSQNVPLFWYVEEPTREYVVNQAHRKVVIDKEETRIITHYDVTILRNTTKIPIEPVPKVISPFDKNGKPVQEVGVIDLNQRAILCSLGVPMVYGKEIFIETYHTMPKGKNLNFAVGYILEGEFFNGLPEECFRISGPMIEGGVVLEIYLREDRRLVKKESVSVYGESRFEQGGNGNREPISLKECSYEFCDADEHIHPNRQVIRFKFPPSIRYSKYTVLWQWEPSNG